MIPSFHTARDLVRKAYALARPYGRQRLALVTALSLAQGLFQVLGVTSIFPFLALAADPARLRNSEFGQKFLSVIPPMDDHRLLIVAGSIAVGMLILANAVNILAEYVRTRYAQNFGHWLRVRLLEQIATQPYPEFLQKNTSILTKKIVGDVMQYTNGVLLPLLDSIARAVTVILLVATLFLVHPSIAFAATLILGLFYLIVFRLFARWRSRAATALIQAQRGIHRDAQQLLFGIKAVKVHGVEEFFLSGFAEHSRSQARFSAKVALLANAPRYLVEPIAFGGLVIAVLLYAARGQDLSAILPNLGVMALAGYRLLPSLQLFYAQLINLTTQHGTLREIHDEFVAVGEPSQTSRQSRSDSPTTTDALSYPDAIRFCDVSFRYPNASQLTLQHFSAVIERHTSLGVLGPTGSGKSTFVDLLLGLQEPTSGTIFLDRQPLSSANRRQWQQMIGYVPQEIFLIDDTIAANIAFGVSLESVDPARLRQAAKDAQILDLIEHQLPDGWRTVVGERGLRLSGGQRQRIGIARALYTQPKILILDEATSAVDSTTEREIMDSIYELGHRITLVVVAHRTSTLDRCSHRLDFGSLPPSPPPSLPSSNVESIVN
ncbi:MAG: ABC transporter ATP-binding protein [Verrucomicrobiales bacterium]